MDEERERDLLNRLSRMGERAKRLQRENNAAWMRIGHLERELGKTYRIINNQRQALRDLIGRPFGVTGHRRVAQALNILEERTYPKLKKAEDT